MFRSFRYNAAKKRLAFFIRGPRPPSVSWSVQVKHTARVEEFSPNTCPYGQMASYWDTYAGWFVPNYGEFLTAAGDYYGIPLQAVLDLACGTGLLTRQSAQAAESVVGLDVSAHMLDRARQQTTNGNIRYLQSDFRDFNLNETFNAVLCGSDSINYLQTPEELSTVFGCVRRHLRPGGFFVFDTLDEQSFRARANLKTEAAVDGQFFEVYSFYNLETKVGESRVVFGDSVERHRRIPIEREAVLKAAQQAGLIVTEHFSLNTYLPWPNPLARQFYVLRDPRPAPVRPSKWARWAFWRSSVSGGMPAEPR
jgi:2-polyprenyl-3-methyl-5-hydroxy-6-metoxy-1,4-benzoquinol methylase